ncbi:MAG: DNA-binding response regulator [Deltaproteobacteria bacterium]|nr:MAG: DNA-binding response regulator [Deltaproteobacteria bacterium]
MKEPIRILIIDDHAMVRTGMRQMFESETGLLLAGEAETGQEGVRLAAELQPDIIVLDVSLPDINGLELITRLSRAAKKARIIIFSMFGKEEFAHEALKAGALAYVLKGAPAEDLLQAIKSVMQDQYFFSAQIQQTLVEGYVEAKESAADEVRRRSEQLTEREKEVLRHILLGSTNQEMAEALGLSAKTVEKHRASLMRKTDCKGPVELVRFAVSAGLADPKTLEPR